MDTTEYLAAHDALFETKERLYAQTRIELSTGRIIYLADKYDEILDKVSQLWNREGGIRVVEVFTDNGRPSRKRRVTLFMPVVSVSPVSYDVNVG